MGLFPLGQSSDGFSLGAHRVKKIIFRRLKLKIMEWEELLARLQKYNSVALRVDNGQTLVDELASVKLNTKNGRIPDMDETKVNSIYIF